MKYSILPSIISLTNEDAQKKVKKLLPITKVFQLDVMDGEFVKNKSFIEVDLKKLPKASYEAHLMLTNPKPWLEKNMHYLDSVILHYESDVHLHEMIKELKFKDKKVGIAINPDTDVESITQYVKLVDKILIMTVNPGKYGAKFMPEMTNKIKYFRKISSKLDIEVDGGMNIENIRLCKKAGANQFVVGSYLQNSKNLKTAWNKIQKEI